MRLERGALAALAVAVLALWLAYPVAPTYDTAYAIVWGHEILGGHLPTFAAYRAPTEHPLWVALGVLAALFDSGRLVTFVGLGSFVALVAGLYRLVRASFGVPAAVCAGLLLLSRFHFAFYAAFAYLDVVYLALLVWAAALELERPRRGGLVWVLLVAAGLLRPDAWLYALCYALWLARPPRLRDLALVALPCALWCLLDLIVTGHPTFSFTFTTGHAEELSRQRPALQVPGSTVAGLDDLMKLPVLALALVGIGLAIQKRVRSAAMLLACSAAGIGSFMLTCFAGFAVVNRYLAFAVVVLFGFAGWTLAQALGLLWRRRATPLALGTAAALLAAGTWTALHFHPGGAASELGLRVRIESNLRTMLASEPVVAGRRCGPVSVPNHKLVPLARLDLAAPQDGVVARSDTVPGRGVAIVVSGGSRSLYDPEYGPYGNGSHDPKSINDPPAGFRPAFSTQYLIAYARC